ncbi:MAG: hypothetical protein SV186_04020 [Candidatus Nanohaloarchaea archaeon]|nr:hypothetical protein [Candidatus Nanohaloarchaea archaeon]
MSKVQDAFYKLAPHILDSEVSDDGTILFADRRFVYFHTQMFSRLFENMEDVAGPIIKRKIKSFGEDAGRQIAANMDEEFKDINTRDALGLLKDSGFDISSVKELGKTDTLSQLHKIFGYGRYVGWIGEVEVREYQEEERLRFATPNTFESTSYGQTGDKECKFLEGVVKGMIGYFWDTENIISEETQCACEGEPVCELVVTRDDGS